MLAALSCGLFIDPEVLRQAIPSGAGPLRFATAGAAAVGALRMGGVARSLGLSR